VHSVLPYPLPYACLLMDRNGAIIKYINEIGAVTLCSNTMCMRVYWKVPGLCQKRNADLTFSILAAISFKIISLRTYTVIKETPWPQSASKLYRPSDCRLLAKLGPTFVDRGCHVVSMTDPYGRILGSLDRSRYFFFQIAPQLYS
jgi:hypothetical protein